jgi:hypothetical protein
MFSPELPIQSLKSSERLRFWNVPLHAQCHGRNNARPQQLARNHRLTETRKDLKCHWHVQTGTKTVEKDNRDAPLLQRLRQRP